MQDIIEQGIIKEGLSVFLRKSKSGQYNMIALGEGKIRRIINRMIYVSIPFLENRIGSPDIIKVFWEDNNAYFCGSSSYFYPLFNLRASCYNNYKHYEILLLKGFDKVDSVEKRKDVRINYNNETLFELIDKKNQKSISRKNSKLMHTGIGKNLSCSGLEFTTHYDLKVNDIINLSFEFPAYCSNTIFVKAKVVRVIKTENNDMKNSIAVIFTKINPSDKRLIGEFVLEGKGY